MKLDDYIYRGSFSFYDKKLQALVQNELPPEKWDSNTGHGPYDILRYYVSDTFEKLWDEREEAPQEERDRYIYEGASGLCFNTGLQDVNWQNIYFCCIKNDKIDKQPWKFIGFYNSYNIYSAPCKVPAVAVEALRRPNYFKDPSALVFDVRLDIVPQWNHIIGDEENFNRIPVSIRNMGRELCRNIIEGAIRTAKKRIEANYKTAVPQWYRNRIQLLVPLYLTNPNKPDLALVVSKNEDGTQYFGHTCLTIDMAYSNARLITKPESFWLLL
ncbi:DUF3825 domain-containing protein [Synergistes jonesii]|uniref:DUF3825 domain-containing protein n=1 Tax=Synergistes jonesii TaxID=2754 RepID=UPI00248E4B8B|nr:DUF3825 domain-containing protein [Synergistes jonesii]